MHNMLAIYRHKGHSSRNSSPVISLILRNAEDDDIDNSRVSIKDDSNLGLFIDYMQSGTIRRSRQMHYHRNHLSPPLENQPNISRTVLAKCFWEMFNVSSFLRKTIPFHMKNAEDDLFWSTATNANVLTWDSFDLRTAGATTQTVTSLVLSTSMIATQDEESWSLWSVWTMGSSGGHCGHRRYYIISPVCTVH